MAKNQWRNLIVLAWIRVINDVAGCNDVSPT